MSAPTLVDETDEAEMAKWRHYVAGADADALAWLTGQAGADTTAAAHSTAQTMALPQSAVNFNMRTLVGSYATVARLLDDVATVPGTKGIMLTFDDFLIGMEQFRHRIQPLMATRRARLARAA
jgi:pyrimidine oxygenase